jgi:hypothetical protein
MNAVYATESDPVQYLCRICGRDLTNAAHILNCSFEMIKQVHEDAHRLAAIRTLRGICQEIVNTLPYGLEHRMKEALQTLDDLA